MKKSIKILLTLFLIGITAQGYSQVTRHNVLKTNFFSPILRTYVIAYERVINEDMSGQFGFFYTQVKLADVKFQGWSVTPEYRYFLSEKRSAPSGIFVAPFFRYMNFSVKDESTTTTTKGTMQSFGGGLLVGAQILLKDRITLEAFLGPSYLNGNVDVTEGDEEIDIGAFDGFSVRVGVTVGVAF